MLIERLAHIQNSFKYCCDKQPIIFRCKLKIFATQSVFCCAGKIVVVKTNLFSSNGAIPAKFSKLHDNAVREFVTQDRTNIYPCYKQILWSRENFQMQVLVSRYIWWLQYTCLCSAWFQFGYATRRLTIEFGQIHVYYH